MAAHEIPSFTSTEQATVDRASDAARDIIRLSRESQASTAAQTTTVARQIEETWSHGWELFDACIFAAQQNSQLLLRRGDQVKDGHSPKRDALTLAADLMPMTHKGDKRQRPTLERLEAMAGLDDLRLLVFSTHGLVHSDPAGVVTSVLAGSPGIGFLGLRLAMWKQLRDQPW
jgi:hypothetical protein